MRRLPINYPGQGPVEKVLLTIVLLALVPGGPRAVSADQPEHDKILLQPKGGSSRIGVYGIIVDYTGEKITIRNRQSTVLRHYDADEVVEVRTPQTEHHVKGLVSFAQGDVAGAARSFEAALKEETRNWVRRDILALLIRCALRQGDYQAAGSRFVLLWQSDPKTRHFKLIPLAWSPDVPNAGLQNAALSWLREEGEVPKLLGASRLLTDSRYGQLAEDELRTLARSADGRIYPLARAQLWRLRVREGNPGSSELDRWQLRIEAMPEDLRGGPYYVLGRAFLKRHEYDRAATALLWLPMVYDYDAPLAARAGLEAADALSRSGRQPQAIRLYREVSTRFRDTAYAAEAASVLQKLSVGAEDSETKQTTR